MSSLSWPRLLSALLKGEERPLPPERLREIPAHLDWKRHVEAYDRLFEEVAGTASARPDEAMVATA